MNVTCARVYGSSLCLYVHGSLRKKIWCSLTISWDYVSNFVKIRSLVAEIFTKWYWHSKIINFQCIFHIFTLTCLKCLLRWIITEWLWNILETRYQNGLGFGRRWHYFKLTGCFLVHVGTPYFPKIINEHPVVALECLR